MGSPPGLLPSPHARVWPSPVACVAVQRMQVPHNVRTAAPAPLDRPLNTYHHTTIPHAVPSIAHLCVRTDHTMSMFNSASVQALSKNGGMVVWWYASDDPVVTVATRVAVPLVCGAPSVTPSVIVLSYTRTLFDELRPNSKKHPATVTNRCREGIGTTWRTAEIDFGRRRRLDGSSS